MPRSENTLVTSHATKADPGYLVELAKEVRPRIIYIITKLMNGS